jgi:hypothetical protein
MVDENQNADINVLIDEALRKIGRNVLIFQQIESLLKFMLKNNHFDGTPSDIVGTRETRSEDVNVKTMGALKKDFIDEILSDAGAPPIEPEEVPQSWRISFTFTSQFDSESFAALSENLNVMVKERNDLIHHFLPRWQPESPERLAIAIRYLDQQHKKVLPMLDHLQSVSESMKISTQAMSQFLTSDQGKNQIELIWLQHSPLINLLREVAEQKARPDGWAYVSDAGRLAHIHEADSVTRIKELYGHSTLKQLLIASELFDINDEPLSNGQFRTLYRLKPISPY